MLDFEDGVDLIEFGPGLTFDDLQFVFNAAANSTNVFTSEGDRLILRDVSLSELSVDDVVFNLA